VNPNHTEIEPQQEPAMVECPVCGGQQADMGENMKCCECGFYPMPTRQEN
jgi:hypothetical protein